MQLYNWVKLSEELDLFDGLDEEIIGNGDANVRELR
jgi:hypothetical protein